ncbi:MAG: DUF975 family protein [Lachnospiraceae bacterium]|nr:DUF975 family protein [Lachnospiraceae bacterium]
MMWNRAEVKATGKENFKKNYWKSVGIAIVYMIFFGAGGSAVSSNSRQISEKVDLNDPKVMSIVIAVISILGIIATVSFLVRIFVFNPLDVGCKRFYLVNQDTNADLGELGYGFAHNYKGSIGGLFLRDLIIGIGLMLLFIPGIILSYAFKLVPFILADDPQCGAIEALKRSSAMMKGNKWRYFIYDLSFLGWDILSVLTCGILAVFYVNPYKFNADAALYQAIKGGENTVEAY